VCMAEIFHVHGRCHALQGSEPSPLLLVRAPMGGRPPWGPAQLGPQRAPQGGAHIDMGLGKLRGVGKLEGAPPPTTRGVK
jgi:hypothetical protein